MASKHDTTGAFRVDASRSTLHMYTCDTKITTELCEAMQDVNMPLILRIYNSNFMTDHKN